MPTPKYFDQCPPFPSDIPVANIPILPFNDLQNNSATESEKLFSACQEFGFFLLKLTDSEAGEQLLQDAERMMDLTTTTLSLDRQVLDKYAYKPPRDLLGYKCSGKLRTDDGKLDCMEMYNLGQDDIIGNSAPRQNPDPIEEQRSDCRAFFEHAHAAISVICVNLDQQLGLLSNTLIRRSPIDQPSETSLRMLLSWPQTKDAEIGNNRQITLGGHTDIGTLTLLFHVSGGLQILPADKENVPENWQYIRPEQGCALINVGDTLVEWTGGVLRSSLHRVVTAPGEQARVARQSLAYLVRPRRTETMHRIKGSAVVPPLAEGEEEDARTVSDWAAWRARQVMNGELKPQTTGGRRVVPHA
ncbi:oxidoreductase [Aspergillus ibericus CBS 121593]|uniref:Oxidoreductase n=1 Tax=Aspergillus ibericus CBS 121593 TaxID=1448316 RepID=A0A395H431_9EURO|nr:oxidoreductase [Aspergillus ibericus CBS 121593]RAL02383.1 oxidoreductase [Aspergillus ibericus CBS 121593]